MSPKSLFLNPNSPLFLILPLHSNIGKFFACFEIIGYDDNMKKYFPTFLAIIIIFSFLLTPIVPFSLAQDKSIPKIKEITSQKETSPQFKEAEIIVKYKKEKINLEKTSGKLSAFFEEKKNSLKEIDQIEDSNIKLLETSQNIEKTIEKLENNPKVEFASPNYFRKPFAISNDPHFSNQWALHNTGQVVNGRTSTNDADIDAPEAWENEEDSDEEIIVAIIDTGVKYTHEDLADNMWDGSACKDENNNPVTGGCPNHGWNFKESNNDPNDTEFIYDEEDISGHGTMIAGIIAGVSNNSAGISGLSQKNKIKIMAIRFDLDLFSEIKAIAFAQNNGAKIINASYGGAVFSSAEESAINSFDGFFITASGNGDDAGVGKNNDTEPIYPCNYTNENLICTASTDQDDLLSSFSNYGKTSVDLSAPGENIFTTYKNNDSSYAIASGTSLAVPYVVGTSAMLLGKNSALSNSNIKNALLEYGDSLPALNEKTVSGKRLNLNSSLLSIIEPETPAEPTPPNEPTNTEEAPLTETAEEPIPYNPLDDYENYQKYELYLKYEKARKYEKYKEYKEYKEKYRYASKEERTIGKEKYGKYKLFKKNPALYPHYVIYYEDYKKYRGYKNKYKPTKKYSKYGKYKKYKKYDKKIYRSYGASQYKEAHQRYLNATQ